jgi:hypothetical protein
MNISHKLSYAVLLNWTRILALIGTASHFAASGDEKRRSEDTSRSSKGLAPSALPALLRDTAL